MKKIVGMMLILFATGSLFTSSYTSQLPPGDSHEFNLLGELIEAKQYTDALMAAQQWPELTYPRQSYSFQTPLNQLLSLIHTTQEPLSATYKTLVEFLTSTAQNSRYINNGLATLFYLRNNRDPRAFDLFHYLAENKLIDFNHSANSMLYLHRISNPAIISSLIAGGADPDVLNSDGQNALESALFHSISRHNRPPHLDRVTAEHIVENLYFWTRFTDKTGAQFIAITAKISALFGPQFLNKLMNAPQEILDAHRDGIRLSDAPAARQAWPKVLTLLMLKMADAPRV